MGTPGREMEKWILPHGDPAYWYVPVHCAQEHASRVRRGETPTHYIVIGMDEELAVATQIAVRQMIDFLVKEKGLAKDDA